MKTCLIIAGGEFQEKFASSYIKKKYKGDSPDLVIAADRGVHACIELQLRPDLVLGDYDSAAPEELKRILALDGVEQMQYPPEKNYSDLHLAVLQAMERGTEDICILGATGGRMDHMLGNIGLLKACVKRGIPAELVDAWNRIRMMKDEMIITKQAQHGVYVSLLPYSDRVTGITLTGFQYPLTDATLWKEEYGDIYSEMGASRSISNVITADTACIRIASGELLVIESRDAGKK